MLPNETTSVPASSLVTADVAFFLKYSSSTVSKATTLTPTSLLSLASSVALSQTTLSSVVLSTAKLVPKPSSSPVLSLSGLLATTQSSMVSSKARFLLKPSLLSVSTAAALPPTFPFLTVSATAMSSPTSSSSIIFPVEKLFPNPSSPPVLSLPGILPTT